MDLQTYTIDNIESTFCRQSKYSSSRRNSLRRNLILLLKISVEKEFEHRQEDSYVVNQSKAYVWYAFFIPKIPKWLRFYTVNFRFHTSHQTINLIFLQDMTKQS